MIIDEQPIKLKLNLGAVGAVPGSRAGAVGAVPGSRTGGGPGGRPSPAGGPRSPAKKPLKVRKLISLGLVVLYSSRLLKIVVSSKVCRSLGSLNGVTRIELSTA